MAVLRCRRCVRKGVSSVQTALLIAAIGIVVVAGVRTVGTSTRGELNQTATNVGDPATLVHRSGSVRNTLRPVSEVAPPAWVFREADERLRLASVAGVGAAGGSQRVLDNAFDGFVIGHPRPLDGGCETRIERQARVGVHFQDPRAALAVDAKVDTRIAPQAEVVPAGDRQPAQLRRRGRDRTAGTQTAEACDGTQTTLRPIWPGNRRSAVCRVDRRRSRFRPAAALAGPTRDAKTDRLNSRPST